MTALIDLGKLTKPATVLIERVSDAIGGIAKPWQTRRMARADADAEVIRANARIEISEIERRALERLVREEGRKQENIESITAKALPLLLEESKPEAIEEDWLAHFFERARITSDADMQTLWARILADEANAPGKFSKRTIELVATLGKSDAMLFTKLCAYTFDFGVGSEPVCIAWVSKQRPYPAHSLTFTDFTDLDAMGLIRFDATAGFLYQEMVHKIKIRYFGNEIAIEFPLSGKYDFMKPPRTPESKDFDLITGVAFFTRAGAELARVCGAKASDAALDSVLRHWIDEDNYVVWTPLPDPA